MNDAGSPAPDAGGSVDLVRSEEQLRVQIVRTAVETVRVSRRIVTETIQVPVTIRREEVTVTRTPIAGGDGGPTSSQATSPTTTASGPVEDLVLVLHEEVPVVGVEVRAVERITVGVRVVVGEQVVTADLRREQIDLDGSTQPTRPA